ncbi:MAG: hypothetical protein ACI30I_01455 [Parabacteroides sp.]
MERSIQQVLDTRGTLRCVRFESGNVGVVTTQGKTRLVVGAFQQLKFAEHGFLRVFNGREFFIDMKNGEMYAQMPEFVRFGDFEIVHIGGYLCTRTKKLYEVQAIPADAWHGKHGLYLLLPYSGEPDEQVKKMMIWKPARYAVCLLNGDESGVYWRMRVFSDCSLLVMDDAGNYYHAKRSARSRRAVKVHLGQVENEADKAMMLHAVREIEEQVVERLKREAVKVKKEAEKERERQIATLVSVEPFHIGNKWGLRDKGRIVVPPLYRTVKSPVGRYCAIESCPGCWGVMAVDGKIEMEPRYEEVVIHTDGTVDLTVRPGKVISVKLGMRREE